jgi:AcrR family transcriptional regulator
MTESDANRRDAIVRAALKVFAEQGFHKASIKQVAAEAGLKSPSLIYWYFKDKQELLFGVMSSLTPVFELVADASPLMELPPEDVLLMLAKSYFAAFTNPNAVHMIKIFMSEALHSPDTLAPFIENAQKVLTFFIGYLQHQIDLGRLRQHDPQTSARAFIGMLLIYMLAREVMPPLGDGLPDADDYLEEIVRIFLGGLRP